MLLTNNCLYSLYYREVHHETILGFHGACIKQPNICLLLEYAPFGSLHSVLNDTRVIYSMKNRERRGFHNGNEERKNENVNKD